MQREGAIRQSGRAPWATNRTCQHPDPSLPSPQTVRNPQLLSKLPVRGITYYDDDISRLLELSKMHTKHFKKQN